jgi:hypothetical protein
MTTERIEVETRTLNHLLNLAREGEAQAVPFASDNDVMAKRAAALSKERCSNIVVVLLEILTGDTVAVETRTDHC